MKKLFTLFTLLAMFAVVGCENPEEPILKEVSSLTFSYSFPSINQGESMTKAGSNADIFAEFYAAICDGRLVAPSYDLTFTNTLTGEEFQLQGMWNVRTDVKIKMGTYSVRGTATAEGAYIQDKCSIVIDDPEVVVDRDEATVTLSAAYDCALVIFDDQSIVSVVNHTGDSDTSLFDFEEYIYAFVNDKIWDGVSDSYLLGTRQNGSEFKIPTQSQPFIKGKFYVYDTTKTNSFESIFDLPGMEEGGTGVVACFDNCVFVRDVNYREFTLDVEVPESVKENNHMIKWGACDLYSYNKNRHRGMSDADLLIFHDDTWGQFFFNESTTLILNEEESYVKNPDGTPNYSGVQLYDSMVPGQPEVVIFGEYAWGECIYGWADGYYTPMFGEPSLDGLYANGIVVLKQPQEMGDHITNVEILPSGEDATIRVTVDDDVEILCIALYDEAKYAETMSYLDNNTDYRQWFTTSSGAFYAEIVQQFEPQNPNYNGVIEVKVSDYFETIDAKSEYILDIVALSGDCDGDGFLDGHLQHYETYNFYIQTNMIRYTSTDGNVVTPNATDVFGANIVSNTYENGKGIIIFDGDVTEIGKSAFWGCDSLTSVTIPDSVTSIGKSAFRYCTSLTSVTIPDGVTEIGDRAFYNCTSLISITIPDGVSSIGDSVFYNCSSLTSVTIPDSVTSIGNNAFRGCTSLTSITIGNGVTSIGVAAFMDCTSLTSITIPDSVTSIGEAAFPDCDSLTSFYGKYASEDGRCLIIDGTLNSFAPAGITEYTIPDSVTSIGRAAFIGCESLESITIPDGITSIGLGAFQRCLSLTSIAIPDSVTDFGDSMFHSCTSLENVTLSNGLTAIGAGTFIECRSLKNITFPEGVTSIGEYAFHYCTSLTSITIPESVTSIREGAFAYCTSLTSITIPDSITEIGKSAFEGCTSLTSVYCKATTPPSGYGDMFDDNASGRKIYVPSESVEAYKTAEYWCDYADNIEGYDFE